MKRKFLSLCLVFAVLCINFTVPVHAYAISETTDGLIEYERINTINRLYGERAVLALNFGDNIDAIKRIDYQLERLGVEEITASDLVCKLYGDAQIQATAPTTDNYTKWTSTRTYYVYQGTQYEIQIIKASPNADSWNGIVENQDGYPLLGGDNVGIEDAYGIEVAQAEAIKFLVQKAGETIVEGTIDALEEVFPTTTTIACGLIDICKTKNELGQVIDEALSPTTSLTNLNYVCSVSMAAFEEYIFVKIPGYADEGHQILAYLGNQIQCAVGTLGTAQYVENGDFVPVVVQDSFDCVIASANFYNRYQKAVTNFINHRNGYSFTYNYLVTSYNVRLLDNLNQSGNTVYATINIPFIKYLGLLT